MIKFRVDSKGVSMSPDSYKEFGQYVMTTKELVDKIAYSYPPDSSECLTESKRKMLVSFFNDPNRQALKISLGVFTDFNFGYGVVDGTLAPIIMWNDDNGLLNFATWVNDIAPRFSQSFMPLTHNQGFKGYISKITVTDGDVFIKDRKDAENYVQYQKKLQEIKDNVIKDEQDVTDKETRDNEAALQILEDELKNIRKERQDNKAEIQTYKDKCNDLMKKDVKLSVNEIKIRYDIFNLKNKIYKLKNKMYNK